MGQTHRRQNQPLPASGFKGRILLLNRRLQPKAAPAPNRGSGPGTGAAAEITLILIKSGAVPVLILHCAIRPGVVKPNSDSVLLAKVAEEIIALPDMAFVAR